MRRRGFQRLVDALRSLSPHQFHQLNETKRGSSLAGALSAAGEQRYRCKACSKTFTGLTGTPLNGVHHNKHQLLGYEHCMKTGVSVREAGYLARTLTAVARGSRSSYMAVLPGTPNAPNITAALGSVLAPDAVLVSDSASAYKTAAKTLGVVGRQIPSGTHKLGPYHIQNVNALHSRIKDWFSPFKGVATTNLPVYLAWFRLFDETGWVRAPGEFLRDVISRPRVRASSPL